MYEAREQFCDENNLNRGFNMQRQMFSLFRNVIVESRENKEGENQIIIAYEQQNDERELHIAFDESMFFRNSFKSIHLSQ